MTLASYPCCHHFKTFPTTAALFQIKYKTLAMAGDALTVALAQSEVQLLVKMQVFYILNMVMSILRLTRADGDRSCGQVARSELRIDSLFVE